MTYVIYGLGISGLSAIKFFNHKNHNVIATDDNFQTIENTKEKLLKEDAKTFSKIKFLKPEAIHFDKNTTIIFAPGIPLYYPKPHKILAITAKTQAKLVCDLEVFATLNAKQKYIGITGTNGKSTVTALVGFIFKTLNISSEIGGNIGIPCFDLPETTDQNLKTYIFETSSYQLDLMHDTHYKIASLLNITPDHIDRHGSFEEYIKSKISIFKNQTKEDFALFNVDNIHSRTAIDNLQSQKNIQSTLIPISTKAIHKNGVSFIDGIMYNRIMDENSDLNLGDVFLKGDHNAENIATAFAIVYCHLKQEKRLGDIQQTQIIAAIKKFKGLKHRMEFLGSIHNINFINDSKATNADSTENALKFYDNIFWIVGGKSKNTGISSLTPYFNKITKAFLIGEASDDFATFLTENAVNFEKCETLENAIEKSFLEAKKHSLKESNILLSPACASFDQWKNFEERGNFFCKAFNDLQHC